MRILKSIIGRIMALWAAILFIVTLLVFMIPFLLFSYFQKDPAKTNRFLKMARVWMQVFLNGIGCPLKVSGQQHFQKGENYVVVCNHNSLMDVPISSPFIPGGNKTIAKIEMAKIPVFGLIYQTGSVLVDRKDESSRKGSYAKMKNVLAMGLHMCIYPEGTRNTSDKPLKPFHDGAFRLSIETGKAIVPALIFNTRKVLPASIPFYLMPHRLYFDFLPPVKPLPNETTAELRDRVHKIMEAHYVQFAGKR
ncbi:MAG: 1-acyl-sn-glycerol-3-phosphate acyltransferase [Chitinophagaceae bacterium]|nr:1-acyl-sn-glycerol-3-phosphate acyltransferase [Chitinophagaceae bacterium]